MFRYGFKKDRGIEMSYAKKKKIRLHKCEGCFSYYENKARAKRCHNELVLSYDVVMKLRDNYPVRGGLK